VSFQKTFVTLQNLHKTSLISFLCGWWCRGSWIFCKTWLANTNRVFNEYWTNFSLFCTFRITCDSAAYYIQKSLF